MDTSSQPPAHALDVNEAENSPRKISTRYLQDAFSQSLHDPITFVSTLTNEAIDINASDIFFEPGKKFVQVRLRVDGVLYVIGQIPNEIYPSISSRIKILTKLDTTEKHKTQEGQYTADHKGKAVNLRVEIVQAIHGDLIVIRVLQLSSIIMEMAELGFTPIALKAYQQIVEVHSGLILVCGPTGSGKTTTLYSTINYLNLEHQFNIMTIEDPVEYQLDGVNQMPVREADGFTFAQGLKSILRLSPDIILVGEIRDRETAMIAVESGLTGHMVLSTVHAPDAIGVIFRLLDLDIEPFLINSALRGVVAQRLVRKVCPYCKTPYQPEPHEQEFMLKALGRKPTVLYRGKGCEACQNLGYSGRVGIYEVLKVDSYIRQFIRGGQGEDDIRQTLSQNRFITLQVDGLLKVEAGITTLDEVTRNSLRVD